MVGAASYYMALYNEHTLWNSIISKELVKLVVLPFTHALRLFLFWQHYDYIHIKIIPYVAHLSA
jgi:hypothetical protein